MPFQVERGKKKYPFFSFLVHIVLQFLPLAESSCKQAHVGMWKREPTEVILLSALKRYKVEPGKDEEQHEV